MINRKFDSEGLFIAWFVFVAALSLCWLGVLIWAVISLVNWLTA